MARALIVGCGCRGRALGARLRDQGWMVRGTTRAEDGMAAIESAGLDAAVADPVRPGSILELVADVAIVHWLLGSAAGEAPAVEPLHDTSLRALLERLVDTPVRGFVYEAAGRAPAGFLERGARAVEEAARTWRIRAEVVDADSGDLDDWLEAMTAATRRIIGA